MRVNIRYISFIFAGLLFTGIFTAKAAGVWITESTKEIVVIDEGVFAGEADPEGIRGSYSFGDIETMYGVPAVILAEAFYVDTNNPEQILCKDLEALYENNEENLELGTGAVRQFVAIYKGMTYDGDDGFPSTAIEVLAKEGKWNETLAKTLEGRIVEIGIRTDILTTEPASSELIKDDEHDSIENVELNLVKGSTTAAELIDIGMSLEALEGILGVTLPNTNMTVKDICQQNGLSFSEMKSRITSELGQ